MNDLDTLETGAAEIVPPVLAILADIAPSYTYASFENAIPVIRSIAVDNPTAVNFERITPELTSNPPFLRAKTWVIDRILAGDHIVLSDGGSSWMRPMCRASTRPSAAKSPCG